MSTMLQTLPLQPSLGSLEAYISYVNQIPMLTQEEEFQLATRYRQENDLASAKGLILAHAKYVVKVSRNFLGYGLPLADLIQEGNIGLMKAVKRFNPNLGYRLVTFAMHWIKSEIHEYILRNWRIVKIATTKAQRKLFFNIRSAKKQLSWFTQDEINDVAKDLNVKPETVREMEMRMTASDMSFDPPEEDDEELTHFAPAGYLEDFSLSPTQQLETTDWQTQSNTQLHTALEKLDQRSRDIVQARWLEEPKATLEALADKYQISAERVRQLEKNALEKLKGALVLSNA